MAYNLLSDEERAIIEGKGTEAPYEGEYDNFFEEGTYICRKCNAPLYESTRKFEANCGWPSFEEEIKGRVRRLPDTDGLRTEIRCTNCGAHLGHVFEGEHITRVNTRHCVNSLSIRFLRKGEKMPEVLNDK